MNLNEYINTIDAKLENGIFELNSKDTLKTIQSIYDTGSRLAIMFGEVKKEHNLIHYFFDQFDTIVHLTQEVKDNNNYKSIYNIFFNALFFENEIADMFGWLAEGNEKLSRIVLHDNMPLNAHPLQKNFKWDTKLEWEDNPREFVKVGGEGVFEIPVGPIHAGVIEPGHFRFSLSGERIINIEPMLWFQHKGTEKLFETISPDKYILLAERISGDTSLSHTLAHVQSIEKLANTIVPQRAQILRVIMSELERIYNHTNDIGFIGQDTGFGPAGSQGMRLKELIMRQNEKLTGSRVLRKVLAYGGITFNPTASQIEDFKKFIELFKEDYKEVIEMNQDISTMTSRMRTCGVLKHHIAVDYGVVGVPARASGVSVDTRSYHPYDAYKQLHVSISLAKSGDVYSRYTVRVDEVFESLKIIQDALNMISEESVLEKIDLSKVSGDTIGITEGWRGEIIHYISIQNGKITRYKIKDPSFSNWQAMVPAINGNIIGDFPLINKSFNLSYSGNDL